MTAVQLKRANDETSAYVSKDKASKSYRYDLQPCSLLLSLVLHRSTDVHLSVSSFDREQLNKQISDAEARIKSNREKQKATKDVQIDGTKQLKYWRDLLRMMELKRKLATVRE